MACGSSRPDFDGHCCLEDPKKMIKRSRLWQASVPGQKTDVLLAKCDMRFNPESGHSVTQRFDIEPPIGP